LISAAISQFRLFNSLSLKGRGGKTIKLLKWKKYE